MPDSSPYGSQTVTGPGWPNVEEETLAAAAASYEALAAKITGTVVPEQQSQMMSIGEKWLGTGATAAMGEASTIIAGHEINAAEATAIAVKLRAMEVTVAKTKTLVNATAEATQAACIAAQSVPLPGAEAQVQSLIKAGLSQNIADVTANTTELAGTLGVPPNIPTPGAPPMVGQAGQEAAKQGQDGSKQAMQMLSQMGQMAGQLPQMLMQLPQQMMQPLQQLTQPLQQLTSMMGGGGKGDPAGATRFSAFSDHPLAGGSGAGGGGGMVKAASLPGSGGISSQTSLMAGLVGNHPADVAVRPAGATSTAIGGVAPVASGMGGGGAGMGMMGGRGDGGGGGTAASLAVPAPLDHDLSDGDYDDDW